MSTTVSIVSSDVAGQGRRGRSEERGRGSDTFSRSRSRSTGPPLIIPRPRATKAARDVPRFDFSLRPLPRLQPSLSLSLSPSSPFAGRLRGYRNHLTTSSRLGASPPPSPRPCPSSSLSRSIIAVFWIARSISGQTIGRGVVNVNRVTRCVAFGRHARVSTLLRLAG